jgi:hypothetical protein
MKKNGTTSAGRTRWRCRDCGASTTRERPDTARRNELAGFVGWLVGKDSEEERGPSRWTFWRRTAWCWSLRPEIPVTGEVYDEVQIDGLYVAGLCALIASAGGRPIGLQWAGSENQAAWEALLSRIPEPGVVVTDGGSGAKAAITVKWPGARVQRCLVHVQRNLRGYLTSRPRTAAGKALWALGVRLTGIGSGQEAAKWLALLNDWHQEYGAFIEEKTTREATAEADVPKWVKPSQKWWYTHHRLRSAYHLLARLVKQDVLFAYLDPKFDGLGVSSTTNSIEGGVNAQIRLMLRHHRGMGAEHQRRAVEWWCYLNSPGRHDPWELARPERRRAAPERPRTAPADDGRPALYDTAATAEEGLWARKGWAGRSNP